KAQHAEIRRCAGARQHLAHAAGRVRGQANSRDLRRQALHRDGRRAYRRPRRRGHVDQGGQRDPLRRFRLRRGTGALKLVQDSVDSMVLGFFLLGAFLGAVTTGVAGFAVGLVLLLYSIYYLARPAIEPVQGGVPADIVIGLLNGLLGGLTGLVGIVAVIWCQLRGWTKDVQRTVFQPVIITTSAMTAAWL